MAQTSSLDDLLAPRLLEVPDYQRGYAWGTGQLDEFWEDLELLEPPGRHYTGTIVLRERRTLVHDSDRETSLEMFDVVDGQQRLTTCVLLLDRIYDRLDNLNDEDTPTQRRRLLTARVDGIKRPKLQLGADLREYWHEVVLEGKPFVDGPQLAAQRRLSAAAEYFEAKLSDQYLTLGPDEFRSWLRRLAGKLTGSLQFTIYIVGDESEVGVIFETLNQRGKDLTELEKTKNYLLYLASQLPDARREQLAASVNAAWKDIFTNLGSAHLSSSHEDQLLRAHWLATQDPRPKEWDRVKSIKTRFHRRRYSDDKALLYDEVDSYARSLRQASAAYRDIVVDSPAAFEAYGELAPTVRRASRRLRQAGVVAVFAPLLIATRLRFATEGEPYLAMVDLCERYSVRVYLITERRSNAGQVRLYTLAHELHRDGDIHAALAGVRERIAYFASNDELLTELRNVRRNWYAKAGLKYFLYEYETSLLGGAAPAVTFDYFTQGEFKSSTIEHVLPQNPLDDCWLDLFSEEERSRLTHSLGNLVLTYDNSVYSNFCFQRKRDGQPVEGGIRTCYRTSSLRQEQELAQIEVWTPDAIEQRQNSLADWAMKRWAVEHVPTGVVTAAPEDDDESSGALDPMLDDAPPEAIVA